MDKLIQKTADHCIKEIDENINTVVRWGLSGEDIDYFESDELQELELKIKQQILFTLIKQVTK
jgi:hypothetical protein